MPSKSKVLVVDDDASVRKATRRLLRAAGLDVETFESADELLDYPICDRAACLILDYHLPGMSGIELQKQLLEHGTRLPIVFMSGRGDVPISVAAMKQGAVDFLPKPVDDETLLETVKQAIDRYTHELARHGEIDRFKENLACLTRREREVYFLVVEGLLNKQIAGCLGITEATVKVHRGRMMEKMGVDSLAELVRLHERAGIESGT